MSLRELNRVTGMVLLDSHFRERLLNSGRPALLSSFDLTAEEHAVVMGIETHALPEFLRVLYAWMQERETIPLQ